MNEYPCFFDGPLMSRTKTAITLRSIDVSVERAEQDRAAARQAITEIEGVLA